MTQPPGTVSKILWHFTGGPKWIEEQSRQDRKPKPPAEAFEALLSILKSKDLRLGGYREVVRISVPSLWEYDLKAHKKVRRKSKVVKWSSVQVCCLSDIPIAHLSYHAARYGKLAVGFHRRAAVRHGFNPVFYSLHNTSIVRSVRQGFLQLRHIQAESLQELANDIESEIDNAECEHGEPVEIDLGFQMRDLARQAERIEDAASSANKSFANCSHSSKPLSEKIFQLYTVSGSGAPQKRSPLRWTTWP
jgi:hypothetical protein